MDKFIETDITEKFKRLCSDSRPISYKLLIRPDFKRSTFTGHVDIDLEVVKETSFIELNSVDLNLSKIEFNHSAHGSMDLLSIMFYKNSDIARIFFRNKLLAGLATLSIDFDGKLNDDLSGFYKTKCLNRSNEIEYAAVTQFESNHARKAFPCYDEPAYKATFELKIVAHKDKTVLSNMPLIRKTDLSDADDDGLAVYEFDKTPIMSTYLLAFIVGHYDYIESVDSSGQTQVRVYTPVGKSNLGQFSMDVTLKVLQFYTSYFNLKYPLPKLDLIALNDVEIEAMENWGLLVFKESLVLIDSNNCSIEFKSELALTVAHEVAHQWFGNIVTMEWWTDLWLNEGFATWIEYLSVSKCLPNWNIWGYHANEHLYRAFKLDSLHSTHPIEVEIKSPEDLNDIFDSISYSKGSCVIRMLNDYLGEEVFVKGLRNYFERYKYKNASTNDLWDQFDLASDKNVKNVMRTWTRDDGYPIVEVSKTFDKSNHTILNLKQRRYFKLKDSIDNKSTKWNIPITILTSATYPDKHLRHLMYQEKCQIDLGTLKDPVWIKLNKDNLGFYRVKYSADMFEDILKALDQDSSTVGSDLDKIGLINDSFAMTWSGEMIANDLMRLCSKFKNETNTYIWVALVKNFQSITKLLLDSDCFEKLKAYLANDLLRNVVAFVGYEPKSNDDDLEKLLRENVLYLLAKLDDKMYKNFAKCYFESKRQNLSSIPNDIQMPIFTAVLRDCEEDVVDLFIKQYEKSDSPEEKNRIALVLAEVCRDDLIEKVLNFSLSKTLTIEETAFLILAIANNSTNKASLGLAWTFIKSNWTSIHKLYCNSILFSRLIQPFIENFSTESALHEVESYFSEKNVLELAGAVKKGVEAIKSNIHWLNSQEENIKSFINFY